MSRVLIKESIGDFDAAELSVGANGISLWQSYVAGLNPNDSTSQLELRVSMPNTSSELVLEWNPVTNRVYSLFYGTNATGTLVPLPGASELSSDVQSFTNLLSEHSTTLFYRLEVMFP